MSSSSTAMMVTLSGALPIVPASQTADGVDRRPSAMMDVRSISFLRGRILSQGTGIWSLTSLALWGSQALAFNIMSCVCSIVLPQPGHPSWHKEGGQPVPPRRQCHLLLQPGAHSAWLSAAHMPGRWLLEWNRAFLPRWALTLPKKFPASSLLLNFPGE